MATPQSVASIVEPRWRSLYYKVQTQAKISDIALCRKVKGHSTLLSLGSQDFNGKFLYSFVWFSYIFHLEIKEDELSYTCSVKNISRHHVNIKVTVVFPVFFILTVKMSLVWEKYYVLKTQLVMILSHGIMPRGIMALPNMAT